MTLVREIVLRFLLVEKKENTHTKKKKIGEIIIMTQYAIRFTSCFQFFNTALCDQCLDNCFPRQATFGRVKRKLNLDCWTASLCEVHSVNCNFVLGQFPLLRSDKGCAWSSLRISRKNTFYQYLNIINTIVNLSNLY